MVIDREITQEIILNKGSVGNEKEIINYINKIEKPELKYKKVFSIKLVSENEIIGIENMIYKFNSYYTATVNSNNLTLFKIDTNKLKKLLDREDCYSFFVDLSKRKIASLIYRLMDIKKGVIDFDYYRGSIKTMLNKQNNNLSNFIKSDKSENNIKNPVSNKRKDKNILNKKMRLSIEKIRKKKIFLTNK